MAQIAEVIKYEGDNSAFIWKHPSVDFNSLTQLIVHERQEALKDQVDPFVHNNDYQKTVRFAEAEVMRAKGYTEKDVIQAEVQNAYAEGIGNMNISGGGGDMIDLGVCITAAGAVSGQNGRNVQNVVRSFMVVLSFALNVKKI